MPIKERVACFFCAIGLVLLVSAVFSDSMRLGIVGIVMVLGSLPWLPEPFELYDCGIEGTDPSIPRPADRVGD